MKHNHLRCGVRLTAILLCVLLAAVTVPAGSAGAAGEFAVDAAGTLTGYSGSGGEVIIPAEIDGIAVREIGEEAFAGKGITRAVIPEGVTAIGARAFARQDALSEIVLPGTLRSIDEGAFSGCAALASIDLPDSLESIGSGAFENCIRMESFSIPANVRQMGSYVFRGDDSLKEFRFEGRAPMSVVGGGADGSLRSVSGVIAYVPEDQWKNFALVRRMLSEIEWKTYTPEPTAESATATPVITQAPTDTPTQAPTEAPTQQQSTPQPKAAPKVTVRESEVRRGAVAWFTVEATPGNRVNLYINGVKSENSSFYMGTSGIQEYACSFSDMGRLKIQFGYDNGLLSEPVALKVTSGEQVSVSDVTVWNNYTFIVFDEEMEWDSANTFCRALGGFMLEIDSEAKQAFAEEILSSAGESEAYWIGVMKRDGEYIYPTERELTFSKWENGALFSEIDEHAEIYRAADGSGYLWRPADGLNAVNHGFICELAPDKLAMLGYDDVIGEVALCVDTSDEAFLATLETRLSALDGQTYVELQEAVTAVGGSYHEKKGLVEFSLPTVDGRVFTGSFMRKSVMPGAEFDVMIWNDGNARALPVTRQGVKQELSIRLDDLLAITGCYPK